MRPRLRRYDRVCKFCNENAIEDEIHYMINCSQYKEERALLFDNICRKSYLSIRLEMLTIIKWLNVNKLSLNISKTSLLIFDNIQLLAKIDLGNDYVIEEIKSVKYLGLIGHFDQ